MNNIDRRVRFRIVTWILMALLPVTTVLDCAANDSSTEPVVNAEWVPFIELAKDAACAGKRNRLYAIDNTLVFHDTAGDCSDASFAENLFGATPDDLLCQYADNIAGPQKSCPDPTYAAMFDVIIANLDRPDLGLGSDHKVVRIQF